MSKGNVIRIKKSFGIKNNEFICEKNLDTIHNQQPNIFSSLDAQIFGVFFHLRRRKVAINDTILKTIDLKLVKNID